MAKIAEHYMIILENQYKVNCLKSSEDSSCSMSSVSSLLSQDDKEEVVKAPKGVLKKMTELLKSGKEDEDKDIKTIFEKVLAEFRNIEYCLEHYINLAQGHQKEKFSAIVKNESLMIRKSDTKSINFPAEFGSDQESDSSNG